MVVAANVRMAELLVALAAEPDQAPLLLSGCAWGLVLCSGFAPGPQQQQVTQRAWELGWCERAVATLVAMREARGEGDWAGARRGADGTPGTIFFGLAAMLPPFFSTELQPAVRAFIATSGLFQLALGTIRHFAQRPAAEASSACLIFFSFRMVTFARNEPGSPPACTRTTVLIWRNMRCN